jgi:hypothetical protein
MNAYVGEDGHLYVTKTNTIIDVTGGTQKTWWDYELWNTSGPRPAN